MLFVAAALGGSGCALSLLDFVLKKEARRDETSRSHTAAIMGKKARAARNSAARLQREQDDEASAKKQLFEGPGK